MSLGRDYIDETQFESDYPFGIPNKVWKSSSGEIEVTKMTEQHIKNCMKLVGEDDNWYWFFENELERRRKEVKE